MTPTHHTTTPQSLSLKVDLEAQRVDGRATLWVVLPPLPTPPAPDDTSQQQQQQQQQPQPVDYRLHARQMAISGVRVNGAVVPFSYPRPSLDLLREFVPPTEKGDGQQPAPQTGEAADLHYRCQFVAAQEGELGLQLPPGGGWKKERDAEVGETVPKVVLNTDMRVRWLVGWLVWWIFVCT
jgi:hypothetical protein